MRDSATQSANCTTGGVCRKGREDGGGDKLQGRSSTRQTVPRVGFAEKGGRTVEATNDKHLMARVCRNWSGEVEAIHKLRTCAGVHEKWCSSIKNVRRGARNNNVHRVSRQICVSRGARTNVRKR